MLAAMYTEVYLRFVRSGLLSIINGCFPNCRVSNMCALVALVAVAVTTSSFADCGMSDLSSPIFPNHSRNAALLTSEKPL